MKNSLRFILLISILFLFAGCSTVEPVIDDYVSIAKKNDVSNEYASELAKWTKKGILYSEFETRAYIISTYMSPEFRRAYEQEYSRLYELSLSEQIKYSRIKTNQEKESTEFYVYAYNPDRDAIDFSKADSIWKIYLLDARGLRIEPIDIRQIKNINPLVEQLYPYVNQYHGKFYSIKFPPLSAPQKQRLTMVFTGVLGHIDLVWQ